MARIMLAATLAAAAIVCVPPAAGAAQLEGTSWWATSEFCKADTILFRPDGTASIEEFMGDQGTARWSLDGSRLSIAFDQWYGGIEGTVVSDSRIEATVTWSSGGDVYHDSCVFEPR